MAHTEKVKKTKAVSIVFCPCCKRMPKRSDMIKISDFGIVTPKQYCDSCGAPVFEADIEVTV